MKPSEKILQSIIILVEILELTIMEIIKEELGVKMAVAIYLVMSKMLKQINNMKISTSNLNIKFKLIINKYIILININIIIRPIF